MRRFFATVFILIALLTGGCSTLAALDYLSQMISGRYVQYGDVVVAFFVPGFIITALFGYIGWRLWRRPRQ